MEPPRGELTGVTRGRSDSRPSHGPGSHPGRRLNLLLARASIHFLRLQTLL